MLSTQAFTKARLRPSLLAHLRPWERRGISKNGPVEWNDKPVLTVLRSFATSRGVLGARLTPEMLQQDYLHHHPDFHHDAVEAMSRSPSVPDQNQARKQNAINGFERNRTTLNFQGELCGASHSGRGGRRFKSCHSDQHLAGS